MTLCVPEFPAVALVIQLQHFLEIIQFLQLPMFLQLQHFQLFLQILQILDPNSVPAAPPVPEVHSYYSSFGSKSFSVFYSTRSSYINRAPGFWGDFPGAQWLANKSLIRKKSTNEIKKENFLRFQVSVIKKNVCRHVKHNYLSTYLKS